MEKINANKASGETLYFSFVRSNTSNTVAQMENSQRNDRLEEIRLRRLFARRRHGSFDKYSSGKRDNRRDDSEVGLAPICLPFAVWADREFSLDHDINETAFSMTLTLFPIRSVEHRRSKRGSYENEELVCTDAVFDLDIRYF